MRARGAPDLNRGRANALPQMCPHAALRADLRWAPLPVRCLRERSRICLTTDCTNNRRLRTFPVKPTDSKTHMASKGIGGRV